MKTEVTTSYTTGTTIGLGTCEAADFLTGLAISTIAQCREMISIKEGGALKSTTKLPHYNEIISKYCDGVHGAVLSNILSQNVKILYAFVQDCVLNETVAGLYLLRKFAKNGHPTYKLITLSLKEYTKLLEEEFSIMEKEMPSDFTKYCEYNDRFEKMF